MAPPSSRRAHGGGTHPLSLAEAGIGTLRERPLHAALKRWYATPGDRIETPVAGYVIDLVRDGLLIEIQTRGLSGVRHKVADLLALGHRVRLVLPLPLDTSIVRIGADGALLSRRRSPKHGLPCDAFGELVGIAGSLSHDRLEIDLVLVEIEEERRHAVNGPWRRRGWTVVERRLVGVHETVPFRSVADLAAVLPAGLPDPFTTADLAAALRRPRRLAQQMAYCLRLAGAIAAEPRGGRAIAYRTLIPV